MNGLPYYKAYPRDFIEGTIGLPFEIKCAYRVVLDLIYMQGGNLPDDPRYISGLLGCSIRKWKSIRLELLRLGKIQADGDVLTNKRAVFELETLAKLQDKQRENRSRPNKNKGLQKPRSNHTEPEPDIIKEPNGSLPNRETSPRPANDISRAVSRFNHAADKAGWPKVQKITPNRSKQLRARLADCGGIEGWEVALRRAFDSDFCRGRTANPWSGFCFDWLTKPSNFTKLMEGNYDNRTPPSPDEPSPRREDRSDPAIEQIARLARLGETSGDGGCGTRSHGQEDGSLWLGTG